MSDHTPELSPDHRGEPRSERDTRRERFARVEEIFHRAAAMSGPQRAAYIAEACAGDRELRREVESLLATPDADSGELEAPVREALAGAAAEAGAQPAQRGVASAVVGGMLSGEVNNSTTAERAPMPPSDHSLPNSLIGQQLGPYRVGERIGVGGMGEVYRAHDSKLGRDVAIKVLPREYARDAERLARFRREARTLASLNHPNIAAIYGLEEVSSADGITPCLVMELVPGETLAEKIRGGASGARDSGRPLPLREALEIAQQIATGLEHAHEKGIIHRDLKPANVKITSEGTVKLLDFGLAKAFVGDSGVNAPANTDDISTLTHLPPITPSTPTAPGLLLGTPAYMSPEQARGQQVDKRTDIWALGCVLYEMLTGRQTFSGPSVTDILSKVINQDPDWSALPADTPPSIRALLRRCLHKDPRHRARDAADTRLQLDDALNASASAQQTIPAQLAAPAMHRWQWAVAAGVICALLAGGVVWKLRSPGASEPKTVARFAITLPPGDYLQTDKSSPSLDLSRDGKRVVYVATHAGVQQLFSREIDSMVAQPIHGTERGHSPFLSPDGQSVGYVNIPKLWKIALGGGISQTILNGVRNENGGANWGQADTIVYAQGSGDSIQSVLASGGGSNRVTALKGENSHRWAQMLPGGKALLFTNFISAGDTSQILVERTDTHERKILVQGGSFPRYVSTGHLLFSRAAAIWAVGFDIDKLDVVGQPTMVVEGVMQTAAGAGQFSVSNSGALAYIPGGLQGTDRTLVWVDRKGKEEPLSAPLRSYTQPRLSPDGQHLAINVDSNIWIYDMARGTLTRLTFEGANLRPLWSPDGKRVAYQSNQGGTSNIWWKLADGTGGEEQVTESKFLYLASSISTDLSIAYIETHTDTNRDIFVTPLKGDRKPKPWLQTQFDETYPQYSPDGKWISYVSNESGRFEIYVRPASGSGGKWQISTEGGIAEIWNPNGKELFYLNGDKMYAVDIKTEPFFSAGAPHLLFEGIYEHQPGVGANYNVSPDGQRFLMIKPGGMRQEGATQINVVLNWFEELKQKVPVK